MRLLNLAKECKNILTFTHVSTAYVNSNLRQNNIEEKIYDLLGQEDPDEAIDAILKMNP
jgi:hypothetical protein